MLCSSESKDIEIKNLGEQSASLIAENFLPLG
nr:MAG TPA: hypothetical protein [Caudoviricetes sp.]